ncbi:hypothetical protein [Xenorhabdus doucetiae]|nr:hypothetical protein [Xenorhabdus sp. 3]
MPPDYRPARRFSAPAICASASTTAFYCFPDATTQTNRPQPTD